MILPHDACTRNGHNFRNDIGTALGISGSTGHSNLARTASGVEDYRCSQCGNSISDLKAAQSRESEIEDKVFDILFDTGLLTEDEPDPDRPSEPSCDCDKCSVPPAEPDDTCTDSTCPMCTPGFTGTVHYDKPVTLVFDEGQLTSITQFPSFGLQ